ncbi:amidohydrolase [candidate division WOR-3 bacterium]|nr:amidohydrolase [candidate division WOR-3 bacterium]
MKSYISDDLLENVIAIRRHFHMNPELSLKEFKTASFIRDYLIERGFAVESDFAFTAVAGFKRFGDGPCILLRSDMDALALEDKKEVYYSSKNKNVCHACGHDGHMAMLLGVAEILCKMKTGLKGSVFLMFQPAEEGGAGGEKVVQSGVLEKYGVDEVYSIHLYTGVETGSFICPDGEFLASADEFEINVTGLGCHGAQPHLGKDPILAASNIVISLQSVVSRSIDPLQSSVVTIGQFKAGHAHNVIPDSAYLSGTFRAFNGSTRDVILEKIKHIADKTAKAYGSQSDLKLFASYPPTVNKPENAAFFREAAKESKAIKEVVENLKIAVAEDFSFYLNRYPGAMGFLGAGNSEKGANHPHHSPYFDIDEDALGIGIDVFMNLLLKKLGG